MPGIERSCNGTNNTPTMVEIIIMFEMLCIVFLVVALGTGLSNG